MITTTTQKRKFGECDTCDSKNVQITLEHHNIWMCESCKTEDDERTEKNKQVQAIITEAKVIDTTIELKSDIFNAVTVPATAIKAAIWADDSIPDNKKDFAYTSMMNERHLHFKKIVFERRAELLKLENEMLAWQVQAQHAAGKLHGEERAKFREIDVNYQPAPVKSVKVAAGVSGKKGPSKNDYKRNEMAAAVEKYGLPANAIRMMMLRKNMTADEAGKALAAAENQASASVSN